MIQIVDFKKVDMTKDELDLYQKIVKSYTYGPNKGEDFFKDLFETNDDGIILFLRPPSKKFISFEIYLFLMSLMQQQHIRQMYKEVYSIRDQMKDKLKEIEEKLSNLEK